MLRMLFRYAQLPLRRKILLIEASLMLTIAALMVWRAPFRRLVSRLGTSGCESPQELSTEQNLLAREVEWALATLSRGWVRCLPRPPTCLMLASAGQILLQRRKIPATVYLGVGSEVPGNGRKFDAHAWLRCGNRILTGKIEAERFKPLACFSFWAERHVRGNENVQ